MKKVLIIAAIILLSILSAIVIFAYTLDLNRYKQEIANQIEQATGRKFSIAGEIRLKKSLRPTLRIEQASLSNADWSKDPVMLKLGTLDVSIKILPLLKKQLAIDHFTIIDAQLLLEENDKKQNNWTLQQTAKRPLATPESATTQTMSIDFHDVRFNNITVTLRKAPPAKVLLLHFDELKLGRSTSDSPLKVAVNQLTLRNTSWSHSKDLLHLDQLLGEFEFEPLLDGNIIANHLELDGGQILLEKNAKGEANWDFKLSKKDPDEVPSPPPTLKDVQLKKLSVSYYQSGSNKTDVLLVDNFNITGKTADNPMTLAGKFKLNNQQGNINGSVDNPDSISNNKPVKLDIQLALGQSSVLFKGALAQPHDGKGIDLSIKLQSKSLAELGKAIGMTIPEQGAGFFQAEVSDKNDSYQFSNLVLQAGNYKAHGNLDIRTQDRLYISGDITTDGSISLGSANAAAGSIDAATKSPKTKLFSTDKLPLQALKTVDADIKLAINSLILANNAVDNTKLRAQLRDGRLNIGDFSSNTLGGSINGRIAVDASTSDSANITANINLTNIQPGKIYGFDNMISGAPITSAIALTGRGDSVAGIMASINGNIMLRVGKGQIESSAFNAKKNNSVMLVLKLLNPLGSADRIILDCAVVRFSAKNGIAISEHGLGLMTDKILVLGGGEVNFKNETLNLDMTPELKAGKLNIASMGGVVRVGGTLAQPQPQMSKEKALRAAAVAGAKAATIGWASLALNAFDEKSNTCAIAAGEALLPKKSEDTISVETAKKVTAKTTDAIIKSGKKIGGTIFDIFKK